MDGITAISFHLQHFHICIDTVFNLAFAEVPIVNHIGIEDKNGNTGLFPDDPGDIILPERIGLATAVGMHHETVNIIFVYHADNAFSHIPDADIQVDPGICFCHGIDKIVLINVLNAAAPG